MYTRILEPDNYSMTCWIVSELTQAGFHPSPVPDSAHVQPEGAAHRFWVEVPDEERRAAVEFLIEHGHEWTLEP